MSNKTDHVIKITLQDKSDEFCQNIKQNDCLTNWDPFYKW